MTTRDAIPLPPKDAEVHTMSCQYCIVGCGYKSYVWSASGPNGTPDAAGNALGADYPVAPLSGQWIAPSMFNVIRRADGKDYNVAIVPDKDCVVNKGNHSPARRLQRPGHLVTLRSDLRPVAVPDGEGGRRPAADLLGRRHRDHGRDDRPTPRSSTAARPWPSASTPISSMRTPSRSRSSTSATSAPPTAPSITAPRWAARRRRSPISVWRPGARPTRTA